MNRLMMLSILISISFNSFAGRLLADHGSTLDIVCEDSECSRFEVMVHYASTNEYEAVYRGLSIENSQNEICDAVPLTNNSSIVLTAYEVGTAGMSVGLAAAYFAYVKLNNEYLSAFSMACFVGTGIAVDLVKLPFVPVIVLGVHGAKAIQDKTTQNAIKHLLNPSVSKKRNISDKAFRNILNAMKYAYRQQR